MNRPLTADMYPSIEWVDKPVVIDSSYTENVDLVPKKASQAVMDPISIENHVDLLFGDFPPAPFAYFEPFPGYKNRIKRLFFRRVLSSFNPDQVIHLIDDLFENGFEDASGQSDVLYEMLHSVKYLNELLEQIISNLLSTLRT